MKSVLILALLLALVSNISSRNNFELDEKYTTMSFSESKTKGDYLIFWDAGSSGSKVRLYEGFEGKTKTYTS